MKILIVIVAAIIVIGKIIYNSIQYPEDKSSKTSIFSEKEISDRTAISLALDAKNIKYKRAIVEERTYSHRGAFVKDIYCVKYWI